MDRKQKTTVVVYSVLNLTIAAILMIALARIGELNNPLNEHERLIDKLIERQTISQSQINEMRATPPRR